MTLTPKKAQRLIGKRVVSIEINSWNVREHGREIVHDVNCILLEDGTQLFPMTTETDFDSYAVEMVVKRARSKTHIILGGGT